MFGCMIVLCGFGYSVVFVCCILFLFVCGGLGLPLFCWFVVGGCVWVFVGVVDCLFLGGFA